MPQVTMPRLSDSMEEGTITRWLVADGAEIVSGTAIVEIDTDKATMEFESEFDGILHVVADAGETVSVGALIARVEPAGDSSSATQARLPGTAAGASSKPTLSAGQPGVPSVLESTDANRRRVPATPAARRLAEALRVDLTALSGTGPSGVVVKRDVVQAAEADTASPRESATVVVASSAEAATSVASRGQTTVQELSRMQATIVDRMAQAKSTAPEFTLEVDVDMEGAVAMRAAARTLEGCDVPSLNDFVIRACALALRAHPHANGAYREGHFELYERVNIGVAVATRDGLVVPTVLDADRRSLGEIARETRRLTVAAREGRLTATELSSGTFTVSNLGMYAITRFTAVLNPPQAAILAVGAVERRPVVRDDEVFARHRMSITLTCDHRILYGAEAATFLADIRTNLEAPLRLAL